MTYFQIDPDLKPGHGTQNFSQRVTMKDFEKNLKSNNLAESFNLIFKK